MVALVRSRVQRTRQPAASTPPAAAHWSVVCNFAGLVNVGSARAVSPVLSLGAELQATPLGSSVRVGVGADPSNVQLGSSSAVQRSTQSGVIVYVPSQVGAASTLYTTSSDTSSQAGFTIQQQAAGTIELSKHNTATILVSVGTVAANRINVVAWSYDSASGRAVVAVNNVLTTGTSAQTLTHGTTLLGRYRLSDNVNSQPANILLFALSPFEAPANIVRHRARNPWQVFAARTGSIVIPAGSTSVSLSTAASAAIQATATTSAAATAAVQAAQQAQASLHAAVREARAATAAVAAAVQASPSASASVQAAVQQANTATASLTLAVLAQSSRVASLAAAVQEPQQATAALTAMVQAGTSTSASLAAAVQAATSAVASLSVQVQAGTTVSATVDAAVQEARAAVAAVQAAVATSTSTTSQLAAVVAVQRSVAAAMAAAVIGARSATAGLSAYVDGGLPLVAALFSARQQAAGVPQSRPVQLSSRRPR